MKLGSPPEFFEGVEKKVERVIETGRPPLRAAGRAYWSAVAEAAGACVLSCISNDRCDAYLLSESSMFVFDRKLVMITCGRTRLPDAVAWLLQTIPADAIELFIYERKNEVYPHHQPTSFYDDIKQLHGMLPGRAFRFGDADEHHVLLFHRDRPYSCTKPDLTVELLMHGIAAPIRAEFDSSAVEGAVEIRRRLRFAELMPGFTIDDHLFEPGGYSLNAIRDETYWTLHVTPEHSGSYVSFESNCRFGEEFESVSRRLLDVFQPRSFDLIVFDQGGELTIDPASYSTRSHVARELSCGYQVRFISFHRPLCAVRPPHELPVS